MLFGGSGSEIVLCEELRRKRISAELHKPYFDMINDRLLHGGQIGKQYRLVLHGEESDDKQDVQEDLFQSAV